MHDGIECLCNLHFSQNQPLQLADDLVHGILKNKIKNLGCCR
jgi:hypothetical protein